MIMCLCTYVSKTVFVETSTVVYDALMPVSDRIASIGPNKSVDR